MKKGMTLVELVVTIAIIGIIMVFVSTSFYPIFMNYGVQKTMSQNKDVANTTMVVIKNAIRDAKGYVGIEDGGGCDARIYVDSSTHSINFINVKDGLPNSYYKDVKNISLYFGINGDNVTVNLNVDGYELTNTIKPYKPGVAKAPGTSNLCIRKKVSP